MDRTTGTGRGRRITGPLSGGAVWPRPRRPLSMRVGPKTCVGWSSRRRWMRRPRRKRSRSGRGRTRPAVAPLHLHPLHPTPHHHRSPPYTKILSRHLVGGASTRPATTYERSKYPSVLLVGPHPDPNPVPLLQDSSSLEGGLRRPPLHRRRAIPSCSG